MADLPTYFRLLIAVPPLIVAVVLHEIAHALAAEKLGDSTARDLGRITLNPIRHVDPFMTIVVPGLLILANSPVIFGGAKPVPVNPLRFENPRRGMAYVAIAGPLTNFAIAAGCYLLIYLLGYSETQPPEGLFSLVVYLWLNVSILINVVLGVFNLLPVPPLDGGRIVVGFLPLEMARSVAKLERYGLLIVVALLFSGVLDNILLSIIKLLP